MNTRIESERSDFLFIYVTVCACVYVYMERLKFLLRYVTNENDFVDLILSSGSRSGGGIECIAAPRPWVVP